MFREFAHALRVDVAYSVEIARERNRLAGRVATWEARRESAA